MLLVLSITFHCYYYIRVCMCSTGPFQFRLLKRYIHSSCYYHHEIGSIILPIAVIFFRGYVPEMFVTSCHLLHIHSGKTGISFSLSLCSLWWVQIVGYVLAFRAYSFVCTLHHLIIIIVPTYLKTVDLSNDRQLYFVEGVSKIKHILPVIHYTILVQEPKWGPGKVGEYQVLWLIMNP